MAEKKILIIEDVRAAQFLYEQALLTDNKDYSIKGVDRGKEGLRELKRDSYDLVILDINLPDIRGEEVLEKLRVDFPNLPVLVLTAFAHREVIYKVAKAGINDYLIKPVDLKILRKRTREILGGNRGIILKDKVNVEKVVVEEEVEVEEFDKKYIWKKEHTCPVCTKEFESYNYKTKSQALIEKESDFHEVYENFDPIIYDIVVCPQCHYANTLSKFGDIKIQWIKALQGDKRLSDYDFSIDRTLASGIESVKLAIETLEQIGSKNAAQFGNLYMKIAWLYRNVKDDENEIINLKKALEYYEKKYLTDDKLSGNLTENGLAYLIAELYRRTGDLVKAQNYFNLVISNKEAKKEKYIYGLAKRQYLQMKEDRDKNENNS